MSKYLIIFSILFLASCGSMPKHVDIRSDEQPTIYFDESSIGSEIYIDGKRIGIISKNQKTFLISTGKHKIKIITLSGQIIQKSIFIQGNTRREINLNQ